MRDSPSFPLRLVCALLFLLLLAGSAGAGLTVVRLNQEKSRLAANTVHYQSQMEDTDRRLQEAAAAVAEALQPDALKARVGNRLAPMLDKQIVWVRPSTMAVPAEAARPVETTPTRSPAFNFRFAANTPSAGTVLPQ
jgi:hypothetical protein